MGFYDNEIKSLFAACPRLVVIAVNSIFDKKYDSMSKVTFLDKEQNGENVTYMDELIQIAGDRYHMEFQLEEDIMAIRMFEYAFKETIHAIKADNEQSKYKLTAIMPRQVVIFLTGANREDEIVTNLILANGEEVTYSVPCISIAKSLEELIDEKLYIFAPFQQVKLGKDVDGIKNLSGNNKDARVKEVMYKIVSFRRKLHEIITRLNKDGIILDTEKDELYRSLLCVEEYITNKNDAVRQEVDRMGDEEYMTFTQRAFAEGEESGFRKAADKYEEEIKKLREENERLKALQS